MLVIPAIDIKDGKVVRLTQGRYEEEIIYSSDPVKVALTWQVQGARLLHIVDLDGAREGRPKNIDIVKQIIKKISIPVEFGGGIRKREDVLTMLGLGISQVILGTKAVEDLDFVKRVVLEFSQRITVSIDAKYQMVAKEGWVKSTGEKALDLALKMQESGVSRIIYTDISRDGTLAGVRLDNIKPFIEALKVNVIISGGVSNIRDVVALKDLKPKSPYGVIVGKALYEGRLDLRHVISLCSRI